MRQRDINLTSHPEFILPAGLRRQPLTAWIQLGGVYMLSAMMELTISLSFSRRALTAFLRDTLA